MVTVVDIACVLVGRLEIEHVVDTRRWRKAGVDSGTPLPTEGYARYVGAEDTAPGHRVDSAR
jgi:hypothetical protein